MPTVTIGSTELDALERLWHLALSRAEDKDAQLPTGNRCDDDPLVIDAHHDAAALRAVQSLIESSGGRV